MFNKLKKTIRKIVPESFILDLWHFPKAVLAGLFYGFSAKKLIVIGVAGTKGKTTTCHLISHLLEKAGDKKVAMISTATFKIGDKMEMNTKKMTSLSPFAMQKLIKKAVQAGCQYLVLEVSSHALIQKRVIGIPFQSVVFTNMIPDHLEYHKTANEYIFSHRKMIIPGLKYLIFNQDDSWTQNLILNSPNFGEKITYGIKDKTANVFAQNIQYTSQGVCFLIKTLKQSIQINSSLLGEFSVYNILSAISVVFQDIKPELIEKAIKTFSGAPGRMEKIDCGQNFEVLVDYAHSPESLENLFQAISFEKNNKARKTITVFGACGDRDPLKRPLMGKIIAQHSDYIIVTNDDPYTERPEKIAKELIAGIKNKYLNENLWKILDRKTAIQKAISLAKKGDLILVLGKGAEQWQVFNNKKIPWDDREITRECLERYQRIKAPNPKF